TYYDVLVSLIDIFPLQLTILYSLFFFFMIRPPPRSTPLSLHDALPILFVLGREDGVDAGDHEEREERADGHAGDEHDADAVAGLDRKSTRLNSSHVSISYAVFCLKKKKILA